MNYRRLKLRNAQLLLDDIQSKNPVFRGLPDIINFQHSDVCDLRCIMCFQAGKPGHRTLPSSRIQEILTELLPTARMIRLTTAGEPMGAEFEELVGLARRYQCRLDLMTNALNFTLDRFLMMEGTLERVVVSLDSHRKDVLESIRGPGVHDRIMQNLTEVGEYVKTRPKNFISVFHMVLMKSNAPHLPAFLKFARETRVDFVRVARLHPLTEEMAREDPFVHLPRDEMDAIIREAQAEARKRKVNLILEEIGHDNVEPNSVRQTKPETIPTFACNVLMQEVYVHPNEDVYPCGQPTDLRMGSLKETSFPEIWNGKRYRRLRKQMFTQRLAAPCANCQLYSPLPDPTVPRPIPGAAAYHSPARNGVMRRLFGGL